jgi:hypothetical protein
VNTDQKIVKNKAGLLNLADMLGSVSEACKVTGYSVARQYVIRTKVAMLPYDHIGDEGRRVVELRQSFCSSTPLEATDIVCRDSSGLSIGGSSGSKKTRFS